MTHLEPEFLKWAPTAIGVHEHIIQPLWASFPSCEIQLLPCLAYLELWRSDGSESYQQFLTPGFFLTLASGWQRQMVHDRRISGWPFPSYLPQLPCEAASVETLSQSLTQSLNPVTSPPFSLPGTNDSTPFLALPGTPRYFVSYLPTTSKRSQFTILKLSNMRTLLLDGPPGSTVKCPL